MRTVLRGVSFALLAGAPAEGHAGELAPADAGSIGEAASEIGSRYGVRVASDVPMPEVFEPVAPHSRVGAVVVPAAPARWDDAAEPRATAHRALDAIAAAAPGRWTVVDHGGLLELRPADGGVLAAPVRVPAAPGLTAAQALASVGEQLQAHHGTAVLPTPMFPGFLKAALPEGWSAAGPANGVLARILEDGCACANWHVRVGGDGSIVSLNIHKQTGFDVRPWDYDTAADEALIRSFEAANALPWPDP